MSVDLAEIGDKLKEELGTDVAIIDKYGFIKYSCIEGFEVNAILSTTLLEFVNSREKIARELNSDDITSIVLSISDYLFVFTFGQQLIMMSKLTPGIDLNQYIPSIQRFLKMLDAAHKIIEQEELADFEVEEKIDEIFNKIERDKESRENKYTIFREIVKHISQLR